MIGMSFLRRRWLVKKYLGGNNVRSMFGSFPSSMSGKQSRPLKYYCINCGKEHKEIACPYCGSKMKRVG
jgi:rRNA maturation endonuclease Nob1